LRLEVGGQFGQLLRIQSFEEDDVLKKLQHYVKWPARILIGCSAVLRSG
jgi:hypothetical protein